jgi:hypothetical protein
MLIYSICVLIPCAIVPLAMKSNLWPIATAFWTFMTVPPAIALGALAGWLLRRHPPGAKAAWLVISGVALAGVVAALMFRFR